MKKLIVFLFALTIIYISNNKEEIIIPTSSIRYRIIANSNDPKDQLLKINIKEKINEEIMPILTSANSIDESRKIINDNIDNIKNIVSKYTSDFEVTYGNNYFPKKYYKGISYDEGEYESLVISLGEGLGDNWWCVLYPPLCLIDENNTTDVQYTTLVQEILNK
jgi:stage II sporulation protein R